MNQEFKVMTFNLRLAVPTDPFVWEDRKHWAAKIIEHHMPDMIGTQEATIPMLNWLKDRFNETYEIYGVNRSRSEEGGEFSAIFVKRDRFSIIRKGSFMLSETPDVIGSFGWDAQCERICSWVELSLKDEEKPMLRFFNVHLDHKGRMAREQGLKLVLKNVQEENRNLNLPVILTGDFNDTPESGLLDVMNGFEPLKTCYDILTEEEKKNCATFHGYKGGMEGSPIDYILSSQDLEFLSVSIVRDRVEHGYPSDHYPVVSRMQLKR